jgi:hypothetical protein
VVTTRKPPLTAPQAVAISLGGVAVSIIGGIVAYTLFLVPLWQALAGCAVVSFFSLAFPWASLEWQTRNRAVRAHNRFVYFVLAMVVVILILQSGKEKQPFPAWAIAAVIIAGVAAYSVMAYYAVLNFGKWRAGAFKNPTEPKP